MSQHLKIDPDAVRALAELLRETDLTEIEYQVDSLRIKVLRTIPQAIVPVSAINNNLVSSGQNMIANGGVSAAPSVREADTSLENHPGIIEAQMVGTVYLSPGPGADPFIVVGNNVSQGQTLFIIEAMKVMNMVKAPRSGVIKHIFVRDSQPVEYGDPVVIIE
ncbi:acetyl-CoA carboxylase biotin carboxyl carrier protein subunit [Alphaproteobacteria bacterium]|nr:acetyl-CoA carboxylase biotin carboxyl carrier protein subunit [Alphaproteobacteria bacterium]